MLQSPIPEHPAIHSCTSNWQTLGCVGCVKVAGAVQRHLTSTRNPRSLRGGSNKDSSKPPLSDLFRNYLSKLGSKVSGRLSYTISSLLVSLLRSSGIWPSTDPLKFHQDEIQF